MSIKKIVLSIAGIVLLAGVGYGGWYWYQTSSVETFNSGNLLFKYAKDYEKVDPLASANAHAKTIAKFENQKPVSIIEVNYEKGAIIGANITKANFLDYLEHTANKALPFTYTNFHKIEDKRITVSGREAVRIDFDYIGQDKKTKLYMSLIIVTRGNDAYYLYVQSVDKGRWQSDAERVQSSLNVRL
jgi:hypothetical protein